MPKNLCAKRVDPKDAYEVWAAEGWTFWIIKKYQSDDTKPFARAMIASRTPLSGEKISAGSDGYCDSYMGSMTKLEVNPLTGQKIIPVEQREVAR